ncbi:MAG: ANTAR domain-containing response regulator, partial [Eubacteriaceae bacterium]
MRSALIISKKKEAAQSIAQILRPFKIDKADITDSASDARRRIQQIDYTLVIINSPLYHELGADLALDILDRDGPDVILIVRRDQLPAAEQKLAEAPCFVVTTPINKVLMIRDIRFMLNARDKRERLEKQNKKLAVKMEDLKLQYRAKLMLMGHLDMTEEEAHRYIQK